VPDGGPPFFYCGTLQKTPITADLEASTTKEILIMRLTTCAASVLLLFTTPPLVETAMAKTGDDVISGAYLAGRTAGRLRDIDAANTYVSGALKQDPGNIALVERLFLLELSGGDIPAAEELAARVITFNSEHRMARITLGLKDLREGRFEAARQQFAESAYTPIGELTATLLNAWSFAGEKNLTGALDELAKLKDNDTFAPFRSFHEALIADFLDNPLRAQTFYKSSIEQSNASLRVTQAYGRFLERRGKSTEAQTVYEKFLAGNERNVLVDQDLQRAKSKGTVEKFVGSVTDGAGEALFSLAAAMNDGDSQEVALIYAQLASHYSDDKAVTLTLLADIQADITRYQSAIDTYEMVPTDSPLRANADTEIALNLERLERTKEAEARLKSLIEREPANYSAWVTLGNIYRSNENYGSAEEAYDKAVALFGPRQKENWQIYYFRGIARERLKNWQEAEADLRKALALSPDEASVLNYLGYSLIDRNLKLDEAIGMVKKAVELRPNDGYIIDSLGWAYYQLGDHEKAVENLERAVELKAGDPIIAEHLGDAYWKAGRQLEAKFQWQHAKDNEPEPDDLKRIDKKLNSGMVEADPKPATADTKG
jgi:tetratricopeptide (TPR) repeat protein